MKIAGVHFADPSEIGPAVRRQLTIGTVWNSPDDYHAVDGLERAIAESGEWREQFAKAVSDLLEDPDVRVRTGAVRVLPAVAAAIGRDRLVDLLVEKPFLFIGVDAQGVRLAQPLDGHLLEALGQVAPRDDRRAADLLRDGLKRGRWVHGGLARVDPDWVVDHAPEVGREALGAVLKNLPEPPYRERFVRELAPWTEPKRVLDHYLWGLLELADAEKAHLRAIIAGEPKVSSPPKE